MFCVQKFIIFLIYNTLYYNTLYIAKILLYINYYIFIFIKNSVLLYL